MTIHPTGTASADPEQECRAACAFATGTADYGLRVKAYSRALELAEQTGRKDLKREVLRSEPRR